MTEETLNPAEAAGAEPVILEEPKVEEAQTEEGEKSPEEKARETSKERRERDRAYKERLRNDAAAAMKEAETAEAKRQKILSAGNAIEAPKETDFSDYTEFVAAKAVWAHARQAAERDAGFISEEVAAAKTKAAQIQAEERQAQFESWEASKVEAQTRYADFDAVVSKPGLFPVGTHLPDLVMSSDQAADVAYALASDRRLHDAILQMPPLEAARAIGRLEASLTQPKARTSTNAPDPIAPVRGSGGANRNPVAMTAAEYRAWRQAGGTL
jgi:hypothetical protein